MAFQPIRGEPVSLRQPGILRRRGPLTECTNYPKPSGISNRFEAGADSKQWKGFGVSLERSSHFRSETSGSAPECTETIHSRHGSRTHRCKFPQRSAEELTQMLNESSYVLLCEEHSEIGDLSQLPNLCWITTELDVVHWSLAEVRERCEVENTSGLTQEAQPLERYRSTNAVPEYVL